MQVQLAGMCQCGVYQGGVYQGGVCEKECRVRG